MKAVSYIFIFITGVIASYLLFYFGIFIPNNDISLNSNFIRNNPSLFLSHISVMLTTATVVLAVTAIGIGIIAIFSFREIENRAIRSANETVEKVIKKELSEDAIKSRINDVVFSREQLSELSDGFDPTGSEER